MPVRDGVTPGGSERERSSRITPSDVEDAARQAALDAGPLGRALLDAVAVEDEDVGPVSD